MNIELFIFLIKERPALYDLRNPLYKNKTEKHKQWKEICSEMDITIHVAKSKWKNLKDSFTKHLKSPNSVTGQASKYYNWQWAKHMEFMKPFLNFGAANTSLEQQSNSDIKDTESSLLDVQYTEYTYASTDAQNSQSSLNAQGTHARSYGYGQRRQNICSDNENPLINTDRMNQYLKTKKKRFGATELIFIGYAKTIKQFSIHRQARIKMNIAKMIMEEEIAHYEETMSRSNQPSPNC